MLLNRGPAHSRQLSPDLYYTRGNGRLERFTWWSGPDTVEFMINRGIGEAYSALGLIG